MHRKVGPPCCTTDAFERHRGVHGHEARNRAHAKGDTLGRDCPNCVQLCTNCLSVVYVMKGMAKLALCRIIWGSAQRHMHTWGVTTTKKARHMAGKRPQKCSQGCMVLVTRYVHKS